MICLPQISPRRWPIVRAMRSVDAPGANGTTQRMGFDGKLSPNPDFSAAMLALAQHNANANHIAFIARLRGLSVVLEPTRRLPPHRPRRTRDPPRQYRHRSR